MVYNRKVEFAKSMFMGFIFTPVFFVIYNIISYQLHHYLLYRGEPLAIHWIVEWLLMLPPETNDQLAFLVITVSWLSGWLLAWNRSRSLSAVIAAIFASYILYILYLVSFWRVHIVLVFPEDIIPVLITVFVLIILSVIKSMKPKKTIFDKLERAGIVFPAEWKTPREIPMKCPHCGAIIMSSSEYCWNCGKKIS